MGYIYKITNLVNNKVYIGKTERTIEARWNEHKRHIAELQRLPLYRALKKYGIDNFSIEEVEECNNLLLDEREIFWIKHYNAYKNGYNCTEGGEGGIKTYEEDIDEIIQRYQKGERLDLLCKEYHHDYASIRPKIIEKGVVINTHAGPSKVSIPIAQIDSTTNEIIAIYPSIKKASEQLSDDKCQSRGWYVGIQRALKSGKIYKNCYWKGV